MKGLLLKDLYIITKYCRAYLIAIPAVTLASIFFPQTSFTLSACLCVMAAVLPINTMTYDERSKWTEYCGTLPYSKAQIVSSKYVMGLLGEAAIILFYLILQLIITGTENILLYLTVWVTFFLVGCFLNSIVMPLMFLLGTEKARIALIIVFGVFSAVVFSIIPDETALTGTEALVLPPVLLAVLPAAVVALYVISWFLSIVIYIKREI